jgi:RNA recognition motif-containing protein
LNEQLNKQELRRSLYHLFSAYGHVVDVVAMKNSKMRGQAHVAFGSINGAVQALRALQGTDFLGKPLNIAFAKSKSNAVARLDGTFKLSN